MSEAISLPILLHGLLHVFYPFERSLAPPTRKYLAGADADRASIHEGALKPLKGEPAATDVQPLQRTGVLAVAATGGNHNQVVFFADDLTVVGR